jgi:hypothetical protein
MPILRDLQIEGDAPNLQRVVKGADRIMLSAGA